MSTSFTFIENLPDGQAQPIIIEHRGPFIVIIQVDGAGPDEAIHHVLVRKDELDDFILRLEAMKNG